MNGVYGGPGDQVHGPRGEYSGGSSGGFSEARPTNIVDPPDGFGGDPTVVEVPRGTTHVTHRTTAGKKGTSRDSGEHLSWEQRALLALTRLKAAKSFNSLSPELTAEIDALIDGAPDDARS